MSKVAREKDSSGTPNYVMVSVLFALIVFALEGLKESIGFGLDHSTLRQINLAFVALGLALCFFWRRFPDGTLKQLTALVFTVGLWVYLFLMAMGPLLFQGDENKLQVVLQIGYAGLLLSGIGLLANLFYDTRLVPSLMFATIAGLLTSLGSIWGLVPIGSSPGRGLRSGMSDIELEEGEIRSAPFGAKAEEHDDEAENKPRHGAAKGSRDKGHDEPMAPHGRAEQKAPHDDDDEAGGEEPEDRLLKGSHADKNAKDEADDDDVTLNSIQEKARAKAKQQKVKAKEKVRRREGSGREGAEHAPAGRKPLAKLAARAAPAAVPAHPSAHWEYEGALGPDAWGELDPAFELCASGQEQSPIDVPTQWPLAHDILLQYRPSSFEAVDNGHTVQYNVEAGNAMTLNGKRYELKQIHFHTPSEHFVGGRSSILEAHFVHAGPGGELAVLGSMIEAGLLHREYQKLWDFMPFGKNAPVRPRGKVFDPRELLPLDLSAFRYAGSLTTPPCSEKVAWNVLKDTVQMSQEQINRFRSKYRNNARPIQPLNRR